MTTKLECPAPARLEEYLLGKLAADETESIEKHLDRCQRCFETLQELPAEDTTVTAIRQAGRARNIEGQSVRVARLTDRLRAAAAHVPRVAPEDAAELLRGMRPPQGSGELGRFGSYRLLKVLGSGGMAVVFLAEDMDLRRPVALKMLKPAVARRAGARQRFLREAQTAAAIRHENIVAIYQVGDEDGTAYMALEYLEGEPLDALLLREGTVPVEQALVLARQMAEGLSAAHLKGLIHRDIKPSNIFLVKPGASGTDEATSGSAVETVPCVKLFDFGLARPASADVQLTQEGTILGTPAFMAPEQARRETVDHRCDIFSLGCVFYRMLTGILPFRGDDTMAVLMSLAVDNPIAPRELNPEIPTALCDLIVRMLAKRPDDRPGSIAEVINALIAVEKSSAPPATSGPMPPVRRSGPSPTISLGGAMRSKPAAAITLRWRVAAVASALSIAAAIVAAIIYVQTDKGQLIVESNDKNIEVVTRRAGAKIVDLESGRTYDVRIGEQRLPSGEYRLEVSESSGLEFSAEQFEIKRGGEKRLTVSLRQPERAPASPDKTTLPVEGNAKETASALQSGQAVLPESASYQWPAEDLKLGKILAPDFSDKKPLYDVDCAVPEKRLLRGEGESEFSTRAYRGDRFVFRSKRTKPQQFSTLSCDLVSGDFAVEATARLTMAGDADAPTGVDSFVARDRWGLLLLDRSQRGLTVKLTRDGTMYFTGPPNKLMEIPGNRPAPVTHDKILTGDQDNTLLIVKTGRYLETYVNGVAVAQPFLLDADFHPSLALMAMFPNVNGSQVEIRGVRIWSSEHLPPLAERGAARPVKAALPAYKWPAEELKLGKVSAPDLAGQKLLLEADFADPEKRILGRELTSELWDRSFDADRFIIRYTGTRPGAFSLEPCGELKHAFALEATARVLVAEREAGAVAGADRRRLEREGWGLALLGPAESGLCLTLDRGGAITFTGPPKKIMEFPGPRLAPITHRSIRVGDEDNTLLVVVSGPYLEIYVNGVAVAHPLLLKQEMTPATALIALFPNVQDTRVEFRRVRLWSAEDLPPLVKRGAFVESTP